MLSESNARLAAARRLTRRAKRREAGRFLAEGAQAVREALACPDAVIEVFATPGAAARHADLLDRARAAQIPVDEISERSAAALSETVTPQGLVAVCRHIDVDLDAGLAGAHLVAVLVDANDPGNAGTILRTADAAGADCVVFAGDSVDPYNGKTVRASAGSLFHVKVVSGVTAKETLDAAQKHGLATIATTGSASSTLDDIADRLKDSTVWLFGNEARGLPDEILAAADHAVRVPIYGRAESLNLAAAAAVCLYASARARRRIHG